MPQTKSNYRKKEGNTLNLPESVLDKIAVLGSYVIVRGGSLVHDEKS